MSWGRVCSKLLGIIKFSVEAGLLSACLLQFSTGIHHFLSISKFSRRFFMNTILPLSPLACRVKADSSLKATSHPVMWIGWLELQPERALVKWKCTVIQNEWCATPWASHSPKARHTVFRAWELRVGAHQVESRGTSALSWVEARVSNGNHLTIIGWCPRIQSGWLNSVRGSDSPCGLWTSCLASMSLSTLGLGWTGQTSCSFHGNHSSLCIQVFWLDLNGAIRLSTLS